MRNNNFKSRLGDLKAAITAYGEAVQLAQKLEQQLEDTTHQVALLEAGEVLPGNASELARLSVEVERMLPRKVEAAQAEADVSRKRLINTARTALEELESYLVDEDAKMLAAGMRAVRPFCRDAAETQARAESLSLVHSANHIARDLENRLGGGQAMDAVDEIAGLLSKAAKSAPRKPVVAEI